MHNFRRLGRGTKPNINYLAQPNLPKTGLFVQVLIIIRSGMELQREKRVCRQKNHLKAIGHSEIDGKKIVWFAEGKTEGKHQHWFYNDSQVALPPG